MAATLYRYFIINPTAAPVAVGRAAVIVPSGTGRFVDLSHGPAERLRRQGWTTIYVDTNVSLAPATVTTTGATGLGVVPGSTVTVFVNGTTAGSAVADAQGNWAYGGTIATGAIVTYAAASGAAAMDARYLVVNPSLTTQVVGKNNVSVPPHAPAVADVDDDGVDRLRRLGWIVTLIDYRGSPLQPSLDPTGLQLSGSNVAPGSPVVVYASGSQVASVVADSTGAWTATLPSAQPPSAITYTAITAQPSPPVGAAAPTPTPPSAPVSAVAPAVSGTTQVGSTLSCSTGTWSNAPTAYAYQWRRAGTAISGATASTYVTVGADAGTTLTCVVTATNAGGSASSESAPTATITVPATPPGAPTLALTAGSGQISIAFTDGPANGAAITAHRLYRGTAPGGEALLGSITTASPYVDTGLTNGQAYYYRLSATNAAGEGAQSSEATATPTAAQPTSTPGGGPNNIADFSDPNNAYLAPRMAL